MIDISKEAVERLAASLDEQVKRICGANSTEAEILRAQSARIEELEAALEASRANALREAAGAVAENDVKSEWGSDYVDIVDQAYDRIIVLISKEGE